MSDPAYDLLEEIGSRRSQGIAQSEMSRILNLDPRNTFHLLKNLSDFIVRVPVILNSTSTNLVIHVDFAKDNIHYQRMKLSGMQDSRTLLSGEVGADMSATDGVFGDGEILKIKYSSILALAANKTMLQSDLKSLLVNFTIL